jgi:preprotein translocase subunit SecD
MAIYCSKMSRKAMHRIFRETLCFLFGCVICVAQAFALFQAPSQPKVEFRLAEIAPGPGLRASKVDGPLQMVYLHKAAIITNKDIIWARVGEEPNMFGQYEVAVGFTKEAAKRMAAATEPKRGLLAILIDGKVIAAMGIPTIIYDKANISGPMTKKEAENLAAMLNKGSGASRLII